MSQYKWASIFIVYYNIKYQFTLNTLIIISLKDEL
jgi:hypothetical protein